MTDFQFIEDRTLDLRDCNGIANYYPYEDALYSYNRLILNEETINFDDFEDVREFWEKVGKLVTSVKYNGTWNSRMVIVLTVFENLKAFETLGKDVLHGMSQLSTNFLSKAFRNIEILHIDKLQCDLGNVFPNIKVIVYDTGNLKYKVRLTDKKSYEGPTNQTSLISYALNDNVGRHTEFIEFEHRLQHDESFEEFREFLKLYPSIRKINLILNHEPKEPIPEKIDSLTLEKMDTSILDMLTPRINLKLKRLVLRKMQMTYLDCLSSATIYPNIEYLSIKLDHHTIDDVNFSKPLSISHKFPRLKELNLDLKLLSWFSNSSIPMPHVRKLTIKGEGRMISDSNWEKIFPNLTYLKTNLTSPFKETQKSLNEILKDLLPGLTYLRIISEKLDDNNEEEFTLMKYNVLTYAQKLKTLILDYDFENCMNRINFTTFLFNQLCNLNIVKLGSNGNFYLYKRHNLDAIDS